MMPQEVKKPIEIRQYRSEIAQKLLYLDGKPFSLKNHPMYYAVYDGAFPRILLKTGRQVAKTTTLGNFMISECVGRPFFKIMYVSPSQEQTRKFSHTRIGKILSYSPMIRKTFLLGDSIDNVYLRILKNGSEMAFSYACDDPDRARGFSADRLCFDTNVEVLTKKGWINVKELTMDVEISDINDEGVIEWHKPSEIVTTHHQGSMITFHHEGMDLRVTDNHQMWANYRIKTSPAYKTPDKYQFINARDLADTKCMGFKFTNKSKIVSKKIPKYKILRGCDRGYGVSRKDIKVPYKAFATLMGWYIAEGNLLWKSTKGIKYAAYTTVCQNVGQYSKEIEECIEACGFKYNVYPRVNPNAINNAYNISSHQLGDYCIPLGRSRDKYIPEEFFEYPELLELLLYSLYAGDAMYHKNDTWDQGVLKTRSRQLADDVHRAWALLGRASVIHIDMVPPREGAPAEPIYMIQAYKDDYTIFWRSEFKTKKRIQEEIVDNEEVYCFTVPNHRPIVRGGFGQRPIITGQCFDEVQDILYDAVIPVIEECLSASPYQYKTYCGTPKTSENTIEYLWNLSTQSEWVMKCDGCSKHTFIITTASMGKHGPECLNCRKPLNPRNGYWVDMKAPPKDEAERKTLIKGFHISQPLMPENVPGCWTDAGDQEKAQTRWDNILAKQEEYGEIKFLNEVIGVSTSVGARLITREELEALCDENHHMSRTPNVENMKGVIRTVAGVDFSGGGQEIKGSEGLTKSNTVLTIFGALTDGRLKLLYSRIYPSGHALGWIDDIVTVCSAYNIHMGVGDSGEGQLANALLREKLGAHRWQQMRYGAQSKPISWHGESMSYHADRTILIDNYAMMVKQKRLVYPSVREMQGSFQQMLALYEETTISGRKVWRHSPTNPDDAYHSQLFGWVADKICQGDLRVLL